MHRTTANELGLCVTPGKLDFSGLNSGDAWLVRFQDICVHLQCHTACAMPAPHDQQRMAGSCNAATSARGLLFVTQAHF